MPDDHTQRPEIDVTPYARVRDMIRPGDVVLFSSPGYPSTSWLTHVGMIDVAGHVERRVVVIEVLFGAMCANPLSMHVEVYPGRIYVARPFWLPAVTHGKEALFRLNAFDLLGGVREQTDDERPTNAPSGPTYQIDTDAKRQQLAMARTEAAIREQAAALDDRMLECGMRAADYAQDKLLLPACSTFTESAEMVAAALEHGGENLVIPARYGGVCEPRDLLDHMSVPFYGRIR